MDKETVLWINRPEIINLSLENVMPKNIEIRQNFMGQPSGMNMAALISSSDARIVAAENEHIRKLHKKCEKISLTSHNAESFCLFDLEQREVNLENQLKNYLPGARTDESETVDKLFYEQILVRSTDLYASGFLLLE
jgi:hypothetical protein